MRPYRLLGSVLLVAATAVTAAAQTVVWSEEFNGSAIDLTKWTFDAGGSGFGNQELEFYTTRPENVRVESGHLVIEARREAYHEKQFTSARLKGHGRFAFRYGQIEARIKVPNLQNGLWPAFWLLGNNIGQLPWPGCGEVDILEMGHADAIAAGTVNRWVQGAAHWDFNGSYAGYWQSATVATPLNLDYHTYGLSWTPTMLTASLDGAQFWAMDISAGTANSLEEFHRPMFPLVNLAVGGINFVNITDPALITAPFPAQMLVDWIRVYDNGYTELTYTADAEETGNFGVFTETTPVNNAVEYDVDSDLFAWHNVTIGTAPAYEGTDAWRFSVAPGDWFGLGVYCRADRNMHNYSDGALHLHMKTSTTMTLGIGIASSAAGEGWIDLVNGGEQFGLVRDGAWHELVIPLNRFGNIDFNTIRQVFMLRGIGPGSAFNIDVDNVYWTPSVARPTPENGNFGVFTENAAHKTSGEAVLGVDQDFYIWANTMVPVTQSPYEGTTSMALQSATGINWFGAAFTPRIKHNLTAFRYPASRLHFALKTNSPSTFQIGMKSGNADEVNQHWITFQNGADPYGFVRDGQWHVIEIPMSVFSGVDLFEVGQFFELLGIGTAINRIEVDDICFLNGGTALVRGGAGDLNDNGLVDSGDWTRFVACLSGPNGSVPENVSTHDFQRADLDDDGDVDLADFAEFQAAYTGG